MEMSISRDPGRISPWEALDHLRQKQQICASDVDEIKRTCAEKCGKKHVTECQDCYIKVLNRLRDRYSPDEAHPEWFDVLPEFWRKDKASAPGLPVSFPEPLDDKTDLDAVEAHLETLRRAWYGRRLSASGVPGMLELAVGNNPALAALLDGDAARDVAAEEMEHPPPEGRSRLSNVLGQAAGGDDAPDLEEFMVLYRAARARGASAVADLYVDAFFRDPRTGAVPPASQPYIDRLRAAAAAEAAATGTGLGDEHVGQALEALQQQMCREAGARDGNARKAHQVRQRLDELRRGQAAHHQSKARKAAARQQLQQQSKGGVGGGLRVPPCATCGRNLGDGKGSFPCALCLVFGVAELGECEMQVYCSAECRDKGQDEHVEASHRCCARRCLLDSNDDAGRLEPEPDRFVAQVCRECLLGHGRRATYCSAVCAERDFHHHRETVHLPDRRAAGLMGSEVDVDWDYIITVDRGGGRFEKAPDVVGRFFWSAEEAVAAVLDGRLVGGMDWKMAGAS